MAEFNEARAYSRLAEGAASLGLQIAVSDLCGAVALRTEHEGLGLLNRVIGLGLREPITPRTIALLTTHYSDLHVTWGVELSPPAATPQTVALLRSIPLRRGLATAVLAIDCHRGTPWRSDVQVVKCEGHPNAESAAIEAAVFGASGTLRSLLELAPRQSRCCQWLAYDGSKPIGACLTYMEQEAAWFGWSATLPDYRGRGVQRALLARCVDAAAAGGCRWMTAETSIGTAARPDPSYRNMLRAGFVELYRRHIHLFLPRRHAKPNDVPTG
jgi:GNAT superfamily N-acetyltransferase